MELTTHLPLDMFKTSYRPIRLYGLHKSPFSFTYFIIWQFAVITKRMNTEKRVFNGNIVILYNHQF